MSQPSPKFVVGIPTVRRERDYLLQTMQSLVVGMSPAERALSQIVILDAEIEAGQNPAIARIERKWPELVASGWITILRRTNSLNLAGAKSLKQRWQHKQAWDCAELLGRCSTLGEYYLHMEDDAIACPSYFEAITKRLESHLSRRTDWKILSFYNSRPMSDDAAYTEAELYRHYFGLIGQLVRCRDLPALANFICARYAEAPVDVLVGEFVVRTGGRIYAHTPSLFQHIGVISSLEGRVQMWEAPDFRENIWARLRRHAVGFRDVCIHEPKALPTFVPSKLKLRFARNGQRAE